MEEINNFQQESDENLYQAWERFKELLMKCPQHYLTEMQEVILFYNALGIPTRQILDSRGAIPSKTTADAKNRTLMYETRQTMILFPSRLNGYYYEEKKGSYGPQFLEAYSEASHINNSIPQKEKDPGSFTYLALLIMFALVMPLLT
ncbi:hypothetical protein Tco_1398080 [Tanacetum coccineum]